MTKPEAEKRCVELAATHSDRESHRWVPRQNPDGDWDVVKVSLAPADEQLQAEMRADERPPTGEDVRTPAFRNLGPNVGPGF